MFTVYAVKICIRGCIPTGHADGCKFSNRWKLAGAFAQ